MNGGDIKTRPKGRRRARPDERTTKAGQNMELDVCADAAAPVSQ